MLRRGKSKGVSQCITKPKAITEIEGEKHVHGAGEKRRMKEETSRRGKNWKKMVRVHRRGKTGASQGEGAGEGEETESKKRGVPSIMVCERHPCAYAPG